MYAHCHADQQHNSSIDLEGDNHRDLGRISEEIHTEEEERAQSQLSSGSGESKTKYLKKSLVEERRNNLLEFSPTKPAQESKRNKSSKRKTSNSYSRHPKNLLKTLYAAMEYEELEVTEHEEYIMIGTNRLKKPFVEKPFDA